MLDLLRKKKSIDATETQKTDRQIINPCVRCISWSFFSSSIFYRVGLARVASDLNPTNKEHLKSKQPCQFLCHWKIFWRNVREFDKYVVVISNKLVSQSRAVAKSEKFWRATAHSAWGTNGWLQQKLPKFGFRTTAFWPVEQSSILSARFDCPVARQNFSLVATAHDCETGLWSKLPSDDTKLS